MNCIKDFLSDGLLNTKYKKEKPRRILRGSILLQSVSLLELVHASARIDELLLAREKGTALAANFHLDRIALLGGSRLEGLTAGTDHCDLMVIGMDFGFHNLSPACKLLLQTNTFR